jgi:hypothetical protein
MLTAVFQLIGFGKKPPRAEPAPDTPLSDHLKDIQVNPSKFIEKAALPKSSATHSDVSSNGYEDVRSAGVPSFCALLKANLSPGVLCLPSCSERQQGQ